MANSIVELRGYKDGLHLIIKPKVSIKEVESAIQKLLTGMKQPLDGTLMHIDIKAPTLAPEELAFLKGHLERNYNLDIGQVKLSEETEESPILAAPATHSISRGLSNETRENFEQSQVVRQTIRSGQTQRFLSGSIIIYGDVNPGGEVIAAGDVVVLGALRGSAHAGVHGKLSSVIIAMELVPLQLQIGSYVNRPPVGQKPRGYPEIARVGAEDIIIVEEFIKF